MLCPPMTMDNFHPALLGTYDFIYIKLHGLPAQPFWYGDEWITALSAEQLSQADLSDTIVFAACCHLFPPVNGGDCGGASPMLDALQSAGARAVLAGVGENYARPSAVDGADLLGQAFRVACSARLPPAAAHRYARFRLHLALRRNPAIADALHFRLWEKA